MEWNSGPHNLWSTSLTIRLRRFLLNWIIYYIYKVNQTKYSTFTPCVLSWINKAIRMNLIRLENRNKIPSGADVSIQHFNKKMVTTSSWGNEMKKKKNGEKWIYLPEEKEKAAERHGRKRSAFQVVPTPIILVFDKSFSWSNWIELVRPNLRATFIIPVFLKEKSIKIGKFNSLKSPATSWIFNW